MMDTLAILILLAILLFLLAGPILAIVALVQISSLRREIRELRETSLTVFQPKVEAPMPPPPPPQVPPVYTPPPAAPEAPPPPPMPAPVFEKKAPAAPPAQREIGSLEENIGKRWITWIGVLALFIAVALFVKLAIDNQWIGQTGRVVLGIIFGLALLVAGDRFVRRKMKPLGEGLMGGGMAIIYVSLYAAYTLYHLVPATAAFGAMVVVTALGMTLAIVHKSIALNFLALLGGFLTPVMVSSHQNSRDILFAYLLILDLGVLVVAYFQQWRAVDLLALAGTWILFAGWFSEYYTYAQLVPTVAWLCAFYLVFLIMPFVYNLRFRETVHIERFALALANAAFTFTYAYYMLREKDRFVLGFIALGISATALVMGSLTRRRIYRDATAIFGFLTIAVVFLTIAIPMHLKAYGVSLAWAAEGPALLYLGYRFRYFPVRAAGLIVLLLSAIRLFASYWPLHTEAFIPIINRHFLGAIAIPAAIAVYAIIHHLWRKEGRHEDWVMKIIAGVGAGFLAIFVVQSELSSWLYFNDMHDAAQYLGAVVWAIGGLAFVTAGLRMKNIAVIVSGLFPLLVGTIMSLYSYELTRQYPLFANPRFYAVAMVALAVYFSWWQAYRQKAAIAIQQFLFVLFEAFVFLGLSCEAYCWGKYSHLPQAALGRENDAYYKEYDRANWIAQMSLSITWGLYALLLLAAGFWRRSRAMRLTALCIFGITAVKLVFVDLASLQQIYRILSFFVIGLLMLGASYLYHHIEKRMGEPGGGASNSLGRE